MIDQTTWCSVCDLPLAHNGLRVVIVAGVRYHGWCYLTVVAPSAPRGHG